MTEALKNIRRFTQSDWYGWAGAERFSNDSEPFIYEQTLNHGIVSLIIIADRCGIGIYMVSSEDDGEEEEELSWHKDVTLTAIQAEGELRALVKAVSEFDYAPDLSYEIDHHWSNKVFDGFEITM